MAKKKESDVAERACHIVWIAQIVETFAKHRATCAFCGCEETGEEETDMKFAERLYQAGWRHITDEKKAEECTVCPKCVLPAQ
jgi:hypothetical protein